MINILRQSIWGIFAGIMLIPALGFYILLALPTPVRFKRRISQWFLTIYARSVLGFIGLVCNIKTHHSKIASLPKSGTLIIAKHLSIWETMYIYQMLNGNVRFILKEELLKIPVVGRFFTSSGAVGVKRGAREALKDLPQKVEHALGESNVVIFPQGTRVIYDDEYSLTKYPYKIGLKLLLKNGGFNRILVFSHNSDIAFGRSYIGLKRCGEDIKTHIHDLKIDTKINYNDLLEKIINMLETESFKLRKL